MNTGKLSSIAYKINTFLGMELVAEMTATEEKWQKRGRQKLMGNKLCVCDLLLWQECMIRAFDGQKIFIII